MYGAGAYEQEQEDVEAVLTGSHFATGLLLSRMLYSVFRIYTGVYGVYSRYFHALPVCGLTV